MQYGSEEQKQRYLPRWKGWIRMSTVGAPIADQKSQNKDWKSILQRTFALSAQSKATSEGWPIKSVSNKAPTGLFGWLVLGVAEVQGKDIYDFVYSPFQQIFQNSAQYPKASARPCGAPSFDLAQS